MKYRYYQTCKKKWKWPNLTYPKFLFLPRYLDLTWVHHISDRRLSESGETQYLVHWMHPHLRDEGPTSWVARGNLTMAKRALNMYEQYEEYRKKNLRTKNSFSEYISREMSNQANVGDDATMTCVWSAVKHAYRLLESTIEPPKDVTYDSFLLKSNLALDGGIPLRDMRRYMHHVAATGLPLCLATFDQELFPTQHRLRKK
ncbi:unnamed protein product [Aphanomyces euteiches]